MNLAAANSATGVSRPFFTQVSHLMMMSGIAPSEFDGLNYNFRAEGLLNPTTALGYEPNPLLGILSGGLVCGTLDITAAFVVYGHFGLRPVRLLQGIAAGLLGRHSFDGGLPTATLGLLCHFFIAFSAATVFFTASRWISFLVHHAVISGVFYGVAVYFFMNRIVVPLSRAIKYPFSWEMMIIGIVIHIFCVGLPIAIAVRRYSAH